VGRDQVEIIKSEDSMFGLDDFIKLVQANITFINFIFPTLSIKQPSWQRFAGVHPIGFE